MPNVTTNVTAEEFLSHNGVTVFHTYHDDDVDQGVKLYWFSTCGTEQEEQFDVRALQVPSQARLNEHPPYMSVTSNPDFASATPEQKHQLLTDWTKWHEVTEPEIIRAMVIEGIEIGLITSPASA